MKTLSIVAVLACMTAVSGCSRTKSPATYSVSASVSNIDQSHTAFTRILEKHVKGELVDYAGLKKNPAPLNAYLDTLASVPESAFKKWNREQQMAFLINLHNAATLKLVIEHYPVKSIKKIGGLFKGPWKLPVVKVFGKIETLDHIEHDLLRPTYKDPRVHFAVNCASIGCPSLRPEAFQAAKLDAQLHEQGRVFLQSQSKNRLDTKTKILYLSPLFDWFEKDFTAKSGTVEKFVAPYFNQKDRQVIQRGGLSIKTTDYDWNLNKQ